MVPRRGGWGVHLAPFLAHPESLRQHTCTHSRPPNFSGSRPVAMALSFVHTQTNGHMRQQKVQYSALISEPSVPAPEPTLACFCTETPFVRRRRLTGERGGWNMSTMTRIQPWSSRRGGLIANAFVEGANLHIWASARLAACIRRVSITGLICLRLLLKGI